MARCTFSPNKHLHAKVIKIIMALSIFFLSDIKYENIILDFLMYVRDLYGNSYSVLNELLYMHFHHNKITIFVVKK